jgi:hypothetical protein
MLKKGGVVLTIFAVLFFIFSFTAPVFASDINYAEIVRLTNKERREMNLGSLIFDFRLTSAAQAKAEDMIENGYWDHFHEGKSPWDWMEEYGYFYLDAGENLAIDFEVAEKMHQAWMASSTHRANIINAKYKEIGVGIAEGEFEGRETTVVVQMFGNPENQGLEDEKIKSAKSPVLNQEQEEIINSLAEVEIKLSLGEAEEEGVYEKTKKFVNNFIQNSSNRIKDYFSATADTK